MNHSATHPVLPPWFWLAVGGVALVCGAAARYYRLQAPSPGAPLPAESSAPPASPELARGLESRLHAAGWSKEAAESVVALNEDYFGLLAAEDPVQLERIAVALERLGKRPGLMAVLVKRPETAGLLADSPDPRALAESLRDDGHYNAVSNIFARHAADTRQAAAALRRHESLICALIEEGLVGAETVFIFPRDSPGAEAYDEWLNTAFQSAMTDETKLASMFQLAMLQGAALRRDMIDDPVFRQRFAATAWPAMERLVDRGEFPLELAALDRNVFHLLAQSEGERLVRRWGMLPLELLYGQQAYPQPLHAALIETMLAGDNATLSALMQFGNEPLLPPLLSREDISPQVKAAAMANLQAAGSDYPELLRRYNELTSGQALADEVGPPPAGPVTWLPLYYTVYEVPKKILQGRNPTMMDAAIAVLDPVFLFLGPLGPDDAVKVVGQETVKTVGRRTAGGAANTLKSAARQQAARQLGAQAAKVGARESAPWLITQMLRGTRQAVQRKVQSTLAVDLTGPTRWLFRTTGVGQRTFHQFTNLEARIFMRPDRRVLVRLDRLLVAHPAGRFLADTAVAGLVETGIEIPEVESLAVDVARATTKVPEQANAAKGRFSAWQKNISAWWLSQSTGLWDQWAARHRREQHRSDYADPEINRRSRNQEIKNRRE